MQQGKKLDKRNIKIYKKYEMKIKIKIKTKKNRTQWNTNDGHLSAVEYHTTGEIIICNMK